MKYNIDMHDFQGKIKKQKEKYTNYNYEKATCFYKMLESESRTQTSYV